MDANDLERMFSLDMVDDHDAVVARTIQLMQLATDMFVAVCENAEDTPQEILDAAERWYAYLTEVGHD